jgi:hypothetical protein
MGTYPDFCLRIMGFFGRGCLYILSRGQVKQAMVRTAEAAKILVFPSSTIGFWLGRSDDLLCAKSRLFRCISIRLELSSVSYSWIPVRVGTQVSNQRFRREVYAR